jgi:dihydrofolate reductase
MMMGKLIYSLNVSLDGFAAGPGGGLEWAKVDEDLHTWFNDQAREVAGSLYGRRMYELMAAYWPTAGSDPSATDVERDFARIWNATPKIVFSRTLETVEWNSRLVRGDVGEELARLRGELDGDLDVGGPTLAAEFIRRGLVDEYRLLVHPVILGEGLPFFPQLDSPIQLRQVDSHTFRSGVTYIGLAAT